MFRILHRQTLAIGEVLDDKVVIDFIRRLKDGRDQAVDQAQGDERGQDQGDGWKFEI